MSQIDEVKSDNGLAGSKDAFHVPAVFACCYGSVSPGDNVRFPNSYDVSYVEKCSVEQRHGVVSPFITNEIEPGELFWVLLKPNLVEGLTHSFKIKGFEEDAEEPRSYKWEDPLEEDTWGCKNC